MPTINQLVREGRRTATVKSKAPALGKRWNSLKKKESNQAEKAKLSFKKIRPCPFEQWI